MRLTGKRIFLNNVTDEDGVHPASGQKFLLNRLEVVFFDSFENTPQTSLPGSVAIGCIIWKLFLDKDVKLVLLACTSSRYIASAKAGAAK
ncbi:MAG: hypothetical protein ACWA5R_02745 [bacterium]